MECQICGERRHFIQFDHLCHQIISDKGGRANTKVGGSRAPLSPLEPKASKLVDLISEQPLTHMALCWKIHSGRPGCFWAIQMICLSLGQFPILGNSKEQFLKLSGRLIITKSQDYVWTASKSNAMVEL